MGLLAVPFNWPDVVSPRSDFAKQFPPLNRAFRLIVVGSHMETKGLKDVMQAVSGLRGRGRNVSDSESLVKSKEFTADVL